MWESVEGGAFAPRGRCRTSTHPWWRGVGPTALKGLVSRMPGGVGKCEWDLSSLALHGHTDLSVPHPIAEYPVPDARGSSQG